MTGPDPFIITISPRDDIDSFNFTDDGRIDESDFYEAKRNRYHLDYNILMGSLSIITCAMCLLYLIIFCMNHKVYSQRANWLNLHAAFIVPLSVSITYATHVTNVGKSWSSTHECVFVAFLALASKNAVYLSFVVCAVERFCCTVRGLDDYPGLSKTTTYALMAFPWMVSIPMYAVLCFMVTQPRHFLLRGRIGCFMDFGTSELAFTHVLAVVFLCLVAIFTMLTVVVKHGPSSLRRFQHLLTDNNITASVVGSVILVSFQTPYHLLTSPYAPKVSRLTHNAFFGMNYVGLAAIPLSWIIVDTHIRTSIIDMFQVCTHNLQDSGICGVESHVILVGEDDEEEE